MNLRPLASAQRIGSGFDSAHQIKLEASRGGS
jgi:hypothetical protein